MLALLNMLNPEFSGKIESISLHIDNVIKNKCGIHTFYKPGPRDPGHFFIENSDISTEKT